MQRRNHPGDRGAIGFGYDPIFLFRGLGFTMTELKMDEKKHLSRRARAIQNAIPILKEFWAYKIREGVGYQPTK